jgi:hypothetical protein
MQYYDLREDTGPYTRRRAFRRWWDRHGFELLALAAGLLILLVAGMLPAHPAR